MKKLVLIMCMALPFFVMAQKTSLKIEITGLKSNDGKIMMALFKGLEGYNKQKASRGIALDIAENKAVWKTDSIEQGEYIIALFHDENNNQIMDLGEMSIPIEGYAFSNNALPEMGPPNPHEMLFTIEKGATVKQILKMEYFDFSLLEQYRNSTINYESEK